MLNIDNAMAIEPGKWYISRSLRPKYRNEESAVHIMYHSSEETVLKYPLGGPYNSRQEAEQIKSTNALTSDTYVWQCPENAGD